MSVICAHPTPAQPVSTPLTLLTFIYIKVNAIRTVRPLHTKPALLHAQVAMLPATPVLAPLSLSAQSVLATTSTVPGTVCQYVEMGSICREAAARLATLIVKPVCLHRPAMFAKPMLFCLGQCASSQVVQVPA